MTNNLLIEASLFGYDTFADVADYSSTPELPTLPTGNAVERGWVPLALPGESAGVNLADVGSSVGLPAGTFTSARISIPATSRAGIPWWSPIGALTRPTSSAFRVWR